MVKQITEPNNSIPDSGQELLSCPTEFQLFLALATHILQNASRKTITNIRFEHEDGEYKAIVDWLRKNRTD